MTYTQISFCPLESCVGCFTGFFTFSEFGTHARILKVYSEKWGSILYFHQRRQLLFLMFSKKIEILEHKRDEIVIYYFQFN